MHHCYLCGTRQSGVVLALESGGLLNSTYVLYSSDHGFHMGHMRLGYGKNHHYEFDARVPFLIRGPGIVAGSTPRWLTGNVDIAPTFLELAGWRSAKGERAPPQMDGRSFAPLIMGTRAVAVAAPPWPSSSTTNSSRGDVSLLARPAVVNRSEFLVEFTGLLAWPKSYGPDGSCGAGSGYGKCVTSRALD